MFETAELGRKVTKRDFKMQVPVLRTELLKVQQELRREKKFQVMIVLGESTEQARARWLIR